MELIRHHYESVDSTQRQAFSLAESDGQEGKIHAVYASLQTAGYGRRGDIWFSPEGNFYASYAIKVKLPPEKAIIPILGEYISSALRDRSIPCQFSSPNDIMAEGQKIAGLIAEIDEVDSGFVIVIGVGINISIAPFADQPTSCLHDFNSEMSLENITSIVESGVQNIF